MKIDLSETETEAVKGNEMEKGKGKRMTDLLNIAALPSYAWCRLHVYVNF